MDKNLKIMIVAGEASGDKHGASLVDALREERPDTDFEFFGAAGKRLRSEGVEPVVESDELSIVGLAEIGRALPMFLRAFRDLKTAAIEKRPDAAVLIDFPDFNLKLAKSLKKQGLKVIYYISPQLWAWRKYRISSIKKYVDLMIVILPFEKDWYAERGVTQVEYVGNPLAREVHPSRSKDEFCSTHGIDPSKRVISLLPGSRQKEIARILPVMIEAADLVSERQADAQFVVALASAKHRAFAQNVAATAKSKIHIVESETYDALNASDAAAVTSGTATLETGIIGTPMAIVYKTSAMNYKLLEPMIDVPHYGLINLIAGKRVAKELIQNGFTPSSLADELLRMIEPKANVQIRDALNMASEKLGHGGASKRAASAVLGLIDGHVKH